MEPEMLDTFILTTDVCKKFLNRRIERSKR